ncbi:MAG: hypothetical protein ACO1QR_05285 [Chthoniobacteraceae bacterium]
MHAPVDIKFSCTECGQRILVDPEAAGHVASCPGCATELVVPSAPQEETPQAAASSHGTSANWDANQRELYQAIERAEHLEASNAHLQSELDAVRQRMAHAEAQLGTSNRDLGLARAAQSQLEETLQATTTQRDELAGKQVSLEWKLTELEASLRNAEAECARLHVVGEDLLTARDQISQLEWERDELRRECEQMQRDLSETENGRELAALRSREKALVSERDRLAKALEEASQDAKRFEQMNAQARGKLEEMHRRCVEAAKRAESLSATELSRDSEILRGILPRQKEELEERYRHPLAVRRPKLGLRLTYWIFGIGALAVTAFGLKILSDVL